MNNLRIALVMALALSCALIFSANATAQAVAPGCTPLTSIVRNTTAVIPRATIQLDQVHSIVSDANVAFHATS